MKESGNIVCFTPSEMDTFDGNFSVAPPASLESGYAPLWPDSDYAQAKQYWECHVHQNRVLCASEAVPKKKAVEELRFFQNSN
ncbi:hypothetical protein Nmel_006776 [Mimus melanotis]